MCLVLQPESEIIVRSDDRNFVSSELQNFSRRNSAAFGFIKKSHLFPTATQKWVFFVVFVIFARQNFCDSRLTKLRSFGLTIKPPVGFRGFIRIFSRKSLWYVCWFAHHCLSMSQIFVREKPVTFRSTRQCNSCSGVALATMQYLSTGDRVWLSHGLVITTTYK